MKKGHYKCDGWEARNDEVKMQKFGHSKHLPLYLNKNKNSWEVSNWQGTLQFPVSSYREGKHNIAGRRVDIWFKDRIGNLWLGVNYGNWTQVVHCKRLKTK